MTVTGWKLREEDRRALLARLPPEWPTVIADHITFDSQADEKTPLPHPVRAEIVGRVSDGAGLQAMVVAIDGETARPDGGRYHITWSLDRGRQAVESNTVIAERGWRLFENPIPINTKPARWD